MNPLSQSAFNLSSNTVHLWHCRFDANRKHLETFHSLLSNGERQKADKFRFETDRERSIISRGILRSLLGNYLKKHPADLRLDYTAYGKPFLENDHHLKFNLSHSQDRAVFAFVQDVDIGVDIEKVKTDFEVMDIARNFFSSDEIQTLEGLPEKERAAGFYRCWTRKESFIKAKGSGLSFPLTSFSVSLDADKAGLLRTEWHPFEKNEWQLLSFQPSEDYMGAISVRSDIRFVVQRHWNESIG